MTPCLVRISYHEGDWAVGRDFSEGRAIGWARKVEPRWKRRPWRDGDGFSDGLATRFLGEVKTPVLPGPLGRLWKISLD